MKKGKTILWSVLSGFFVLLFVALMIGTDLAFHYMNTINGTLGIKTTQIITKPKDDEDAEYWKSEFVQKDENGNIIYETTANGYRHQVYDYNALWEEMNAVNLQIAVEGATFLWKNDSLPLEKESSISFFGQRSVDWAYVTGGSASTDVKGAPTLRSVFADAEFSVNRTLWNFYENAGYKGTMCRKINEAPWSKVSSASSSFKNYSDAAIITLGRSGAENNDLLTAGSDGLDGSYLDISKDEQELVTEVVKLKKNGTFKKVIILLNSDHAFSMKNILPFKADVDACLWVGSAGRNSAQAVCDILSGKANPSGSLPDTYLYDNLKSPVMPNMGDFTYGNAEKYPEIGQRINWGNRELSYIVYAEGIYSGYRYYETRYEDVVLKRGNAGSFKYENEVAYPFGYGESYTSFALSQFKATESGENYKLSVTVTNTGDTAGKKAVQAYLQKPYTEYDKQNKIEKSAVEFIGFAKTNLIEPGKSETVEITVPKESLKCFDTYGAGTYILEKGDYYLTVACSAHEAVNNVLAEKGKTTADGMTENGDRSFVKKINVSADDFSKYSTSSTGYEIKERLDMVDIERYKNKGDNSVTYMTRSDWTGTYPKTASLALNDKMAGDLAICKTPVEDENASEYKFEYGKENGLKIVMFRNEEYDSELWNDLLDQMTLEEQVLLNVYGSLSTRPVDSVFLPQTADFDGPMGLRKYTLEGTNNSCCFASAVVQGATMNEKLIERLGEMFGEQMLHADYQVVYAPACNIHRSAFSARNSEYYSEDGVLNGKMAAACIRGGQRKGAILTVKHFALNDQDYNRYAVGVWCNEQAVREVFIKPFEYAVREGETLAVMTSYNRTGVLWSGGNYNLVTEILRNEWGFKGAVFSDAWSSSNVGAMNYIDGLMAGNDIEFTSGTYASLSKYLESPTVKMRLRESAKHVLYALSHSNAMNKLTSDSEIIHTTAWWVYALIAIDTFFGLVLALSVVMLVLAVIKNVRLKKNDSLTLKS